LFLFQTTGQRRVNRTLGYSFLLYNLFAVQLNNKANNMDWERCVYIGTWVEFGGVKGTETVRGTVYGGEYASDDKDVPIVGGV
jgi:hypothetical protein